MADRINHTHTRNADVPNRSYRADSHSFNNQKLVDEVIAHLANSRENRRARQTGEWERIQTHKFRAAA